MAQLTTEARLLARVLLRCEGIGTFLPADQFEASSAAALRDAGYLVAVPARFLATDCQRVELTEAGRRFALSQEN